MKLPHYAILALSLLTVVLTWILAQNTSGALALPAAVIAGISTALQIVHTVVGLASDSVQTGLAQKRALAFAAKATSVILCVFAASTIVSACSQVRAVLPELDAIERVVVKDLAANDTDGQIAADVCQLLGGTSTADAICANVTTIVVDVVQTLLDSGALAKHPALAPAKALLGRAHAAGAVQ